MNAVEIEEAISQLAEQDFDPETFSFAFLEAFGNKETTIKRLKSGSANKSDINGGVLQYNNIHMATCPAGEVKQTLDALRESPTTKKQKAKFILATDGEDFQAEDLSSNEVIACNFQDFPNHFGFFLALAGISTVKQIRDSSFDIRATSRLNKLYIELLQSNSDWSGSERRHDMNHFMSRLIFCFFAEDTDIFKKEDLFTGTVDKMSARDASDTHEIIGEIFRAMNTKKTERSSANIKRWADDFPYVNGGLFSGSTEVPRFTKIARSYLLHVGSLDWKQINPDIFGSMIQAVADDEERGALGMHYTSVPNILKVLNPLFLDDLKAELETAGDNARKLLNLRKRIAKIRVFDPACGSGNFLVIAYKQMREIEAEINKRRGEGERMSDIPLTNFRGIELRDFSAEIARLALIIAEYQCDVLHCGQKLALAEFLPLNAENWITQGNALRLDWLSICPPTGTGVKLLGDDLFSTPLQQAEIDFENEGGETYICGNPPYLGSQWQSKEQKEDLKNIFEKHTKKWKSLDYVAGWFMKAAEYSKHSTCESAFVSTNSICQGRAVSGLWPTIWKFGSLIKFAYTSFKWSNLASNNAGVIVVIVGLTNNKNVKKTIFTESPDGATSREVININAYLVGASDVIVNSSAKPLNNLPGMSFGNMPIDGGHLSLTKQEALSVEIDGDFKIKIIRKIYGSAEYIRGLERYCLWIKDEDVEQALQIPEIKERISKVREFRRASNREATKDLAEKPFQMGWVAQDGNEKIIIIPRISSENREYYPVGYLPSGLLTTDQAYALYNVPLWNMALIASRLHLTWISTVCGKMKTDYRYSNTLGWNTFPIPKLTEKNKADLTRCAEDILLAREHHFPATIADLYKPDAMPEDLRRAHERNDDVLERIYIGRRFKNDTERLEKLFDLYTKMTRKKESV